jgi:hypothetical protein
MNTEQLQLQDEFFAAWLYQSFAQLREWSLGAAPGWRFPFFALKARELLDPGLNKINESVVPTDDPTIWTAPSAWHAAIYCQMLQHHKSLEGTRLLFRGHRNSSWQLTPNIRRTGVDVDLETQRSDLFSRLLAAISFNTMVTTDPASGTLYLRMGPRSYLAAAQHYGIKTNLLDFTTDPTVAVKFATSDGDSDDGTASILMMPLELAERGGLSIILPPPFVTRLHLQRGIFLATSETLDRTRLGITEIRFPWRQSQRKHRLGDFEVRRNEGAPVNILPPHRGLDVVVELADRIIAGKVTGTIDDLARTLKPALGEAATNPIGTWNEYVDVFEDALYALAYQITDDDRLGMNIEVLRQIVGSNPEVSCSVAALYRAMPKRYPSQFPPKRTAFQNQLADLIDEAALGAGYDHAAAGQNYLKAMGLV